MEGYFISESTFEIIVIVAVVLGLFWFFIRQINKSEEKTSPIITSNPQDSYMLPQSGRYDLNLNLRIIVKFDEDKGSFFKTFQFDKGDKK